MLGTRKIGSANTHVSNQNVEQMIGIYVREGIALPALICCLSAVAASSVSALASELCANTTGAFDIVPEAAELSEAGSWRFAYSESPPLLPLGGGGAISKMARVTKEIQKE